MTTPESPVSLLAFFEAHDSIQYVRCQWLDYAGILRARILTKRHCLQLARAGKPIRNGAPGLSSLPDNSVASFTEHIYDHHICPDWASLRPLCLGGSAPRYAMVMCYVVDPSAAPSEQHTDLCPRWALQNVLEASQTSTLGRILIGFEIEFHVLKATGADIAPAIELPLGHYSAGGLRDPTFGCMEEALDNLNNSSIQFQQFHVEGSTGQYEIVLDPLPPMQAIDELVMAQDIIRSTFSKHGYVATMLPKPIASLDGSGSHVHISISEVEHHDCFSAGMLQHLPALCAITLPMSSSYERLQTYEAGQFVCWGTNNRLAPIRLIEKGHWEYRCADATMNYYLAVATIIAAGASGVVNQTPLLLKDISGMEKSAIGASHMPLPLNFEASLTALRASLSLWNELLGSAVVQKYLRYKEHEFEAMEKQDSALAQCLWKWY